MIIELAGLPGAGKTTICRLVKAPHGGKGAVPLTALRLDRAMLRAGWALLRLWASARPLTFDRLRRSFNLWVFLRHYRQTQVDLLLDQGMVQKLWSVLADARTYSTAKYGSVVEALSAFAPDHLIWVNTSVDDVVARIQGRPDGGSRYDGASENVASRLLRDRSALLADILIRFRQSAGLSETVLDGHASPEANALVIEELLTKRRDRPA